MRASAPTSARAARSEAERAERGAGQMRSCSPLPSAPAPRESAIKPVPHHAAPVGKSSQTRRHHLTPTPVQQLCTHVQSCDQSGLFFWTVQSRSRWRLCRLTDAAYPLRVRPVCLRPKCRRKRRLASDTRLRAQSFRQDRKENGGCICPVISMAAYTVAALRFPSPGGAANRAASSKPPRFLRRWRRFGDFLRPPHPKISPFCENKTALQIL